MAANAGTVVVAGGSGFVGRHVVPRLVAAGHRVVVVTRRRERARHLTLLPTVDVVEADAADPAALGRIAAGAAALVNLTGIINETGSETFARVHVDITQSAIDACRAAGVARLLQMSGLNADPAGPSRYLRSKGEAEARVAASGLAWTIFQPSVIFGPGGRVPQPVREAVAGPAAAGARVRRTRASSRCTSATSRDCFVHALADDATVGRRYPLCGPTVYTLQELVRYVGEVAEAPRPVLTLGPALSKLQAFALEHLPGKLMSRDNLASMQLRQRVRLRLSGGVRHRADGARSRGAVVPRAGRGRGAPTTTYRAGSGR